MTCNRCGGYVEIVRLRDHGIVSTAIHCLMCGRYIYTNTETVKGRPFVARQVPHNWKRLPPGTPAKVKHLLDSGICPTEVARKIGCHVLTVRKMIKQEGWDFRSGRPNRVSKEAQ